MAVADTPQSERELLDRASLVLRERMPEGWHVLTAPAPPNGPDGVVELVAPGGAGGAALLLEARRIVESRDVPALRDKLQRYVEARPGSIGVVVARYLSPPVRDRLAAAGLAYLDATGNVRLTLSRPGLGLFLSDHGADSDPWRGPGRPRGTLKGAPAARVVRVLVDFDQPWRVTELVSVAQVSTGAAYRVINFLEEENLVRRKNSLIRVDDWQQLLRRWSRDYEFVQSNRTTRWIAPRGLDRMLARVASDSTIDYAVTGTLAAAEWAAYAPARSAMIYAADRSEAAKAWDLRPADAGANVVLAEPGDEVVFARSWTATKGQYKIAAPAQVAVDLLTGPGRNPAEGEELIEWMARNEVSWRRRR